MSKTNDAYKRIGKLASLGMEHLGQVPLYLPVAHDDLTTIADSALGYENQEDPFPIYLTLRTTPRAYYNGAPRTTFDATDDRGNAYRVTIFGDTKEWIATLADTTRACFLCTAKIWNGATTLLATEIVPNEWVGRLRPRYAGKPRVMTPQSVRDAILGLLPRAVAESVTYVRKQLAQFGSMEDLLADVGARGWTLEQIIQQNHLPASIAHRDHARLVFMRLAALGTMVALHQRNLAPEANPIALDTLPQRLASMRYTLTSDQRAAIDHIAHAIANPKTTAHVLCAGEVGTGKTVVATAIAAAVHDAGVDRRIAILSPNAILAGQMLDELRADFPDVDAALVVGETPTTAELRHRVLVGTSAILFRSEGIRFDLVIVDEQHRWSRGMREQLVTHGTHLIEMTATPIPRTQALIRFGRVSVVELRQTHKPKTIHSILHEGPEGRRSLFQSVADTIRRGEPVLVIYPKRDRSSPDQTDPQMDLVGGAPAAKPKQPAAPGAMNDAHSVEVARPRWEQIFPGKVRTLTGDDHDDDKTRVLSEIVSGEAQVLLCTTVVEVGVNLPNLYRIVIVCPERHGLMGLHQLRGRVARNGGEGTCHLYSPEPLKPKQRDRLAYFCQTPSGFDLAEYDLRERGAGDLSPDSDRQSGADQTFLFGATLELQHLDDIMPIWQRAHDLAA